MNNIEKLLREIQSYNETTFQDNVVKRLDRTLKVYDKSFEEICNRIEKIDKKIVMKELSRNNENRTK